MPIEDRFDNDTYLKLSTVHFYEGTETIYSYLYSKEFTDKATTFEETFEGEIFAGRIAIYTSNNTEWAVIIEKIN